MRKAEKKMEIIVLLEKGLTPAQIMDEKKYKWSSYPYVSKVRSDWVKDKKIKALEEAVKGYKKD